MVEESALNLSALSDGSCQRTLGLEPHSGPVSATTFQPQVLSHPRCLCKHEACFDALTRPCRSLTFKLGLLSIFIVWQFLEMSVSIRPQGRFTGSIIRHDVFVLLITRDHTQQHIKNPTSSFYTHPLPRRYEVPIDIPSSHAIWEIVELIPTVFYSWLPTHTFDIKISRILTISIPLKLH